MQQVADLEAPVKELPDFVNRRLWLCSLLLLLLLPLLPLQLLLLFLLLLLLHLLLRRCDCGHSCVHSGNTGQGAIHRGALGWVGEWGATGLRAVAPW
jgi:hypothetical protein